MPLMACIIILVHIESEPPRIISTALKQDVTYVTRIVTTGEGEKCIRRLNFGFQLI